MLKGGSVRKVENTGLESSSYTEFTKPWLGRMAGRHVFGLCAPNLDLVHLFPSKL